MLHFPVFESVEGDGGTGGMIVGLPSTTLTTPHREETLEENQLISKSAILEFGKVTCYFCCCSHPPPAVNLLLLVGAFVYVVVLKIRLEGKYIVFFMTLNQLEHNIGVT